MCFRRHRSLQPGTAPQFHVVAESVRLEGARLQAILNRTSDSRQFKLGLVGLTDSRLRLMIDEVDAIRQRYIPEDALDGQPKEQAYVYLIYTYKYVVVVFCMLYLV